MSLADVYRLRIRGIYATALTKLALDWGFKVVQPTEKIAKRLAIERDVSPPDATVKDHESKTGIMVVGKCEAVEAFLERLSQYADPFIARARAGAKEVFAGRAVGEAAVEGPGGEVYEVPSRYLLTPGSAGVYTVAKPPIGPHRGVAVPEIAIDGEYIELNTTGRVTYSEHIPPEDRLRLRILAESRLRQYATLGLRFKSSARYADEEALAREAESLYQELLTLSKGGAPGEVLRRGSCLAIALFDKWGKERLDEARGSVVPTTRGHHALRAQGIGRCVDLLDYVGGDVYEKASEYLAQGEVAIYHVKPWGDVVKMRGESIGVRGGVLVVKRLLKPGGVLDGIGVEIGKGYYALTCIPRGAGYVVHTYYTPDGKPVGTYINLNTEPEWGRRIYYIDLLVDKAVTQQEEKILDLEEFKKYAAFFPRRLKEPLAHEPAGRPQCTENGLVDISGR